MRLRAINTRGCVLYAAVSRVEQSTSTAPLRSHPVASTRYYARRCRPELRVPPRLRVHYTRDAFTGVHRGKATRTTVEKVGERSLCQSLSCPTSFSLFISSFFFCQNESTVGMPLFLSFRWSVRSLILACTPRASQGRCWEGGRVDEQTDEWRNVRARTRT